MNVSSPSERRAAITADIVRRTGIDDDMIARLVTVFYEKVRRDPLLGPIFEERVEDWSQHLFKMRAFWSSVALMSGVYHGQPMQKHLRLPIDGRHFDHWLVLFQQTAVEVGPPAAAAHFLDRATRIAESLELGIATDLNIQLPKGERLRRPDRDVALVRDNRKAAGDVSVGDYASSPCSLRKTAAD